MINEINLNDPILYSETVLIELITIFVKFKDRIYNNIEEECFELEFPSSDFDIIQKIGEMYNFLTFQKKNIYYSEIKNKWILDYFNVINLNKNLF